MVTERSGQTAGGAAGAQGPDGVPDPLESPRGRASGRGPRTSAPDAQSARPHRPSRRCVATRTSAPKDTLLRLVLGPDGAPLVDLLGRAPGRGVYVRPERAAFEEALSPRGLARAFKGAARPLGDEELAALVESTVARLEARVLELLTLARRAGKIEIGMDAALRAASQEGPGTVFVTAKDLSERSARALPAEARVVAVADKATIGARLGREEVGIVAVRPSVFTERISGEAERLRMLSSSTNAAGRGRVRARLKPAREND